MNLNDQETKNLMKLYEEISPAMDAPATDGNIVKPLEKHEIVAKKHFIDKLVDISVQHLSQAFEDSVTNAALKVNVIDDPKYANEIAEISDKAINLVKVGKLNDLVETTVREFEIQLTAMLRRELNV